MTDATPKNSIQQRPLVVQKYGGMSLASADQIKSAARRVAQLRASGKNVIAVVSAMGAATDGLIELAYSVSPKPNRRELDMLLSTGERVSMALFSMALTDALLEVAPDAKAISFTGSQAGILTDETHSNARIIDVKSIRVQQELDQGNVVILAGFQGVSPKTKEITTLGRGGTDVTAVALAAAFKAERCEILKEVPGVLSADPKLVAGAKLLHHLTHRQLLDMTFWGAKVLHYRSVELATTHSVPLAVSLAHPEVNDGSDSKTTWITSDESETEMSATPFENEKILAVTSHADARWCRIESESIAEGLAAFNRILNLQTLPLPQILDISSEGSKINILITSSAEVLEALVKALKAAAVAGQKVVVDSEKVATVTVTCQGASTTALVTRLLEVLKMKNIRPSRVFVGALSVSFVVPENQRTESVRQLHDYSA